VTGHGIEGELLIDQGAGKPFVAGTGKVCAARKGMPEMNTNQSDRAVAVMRLILSSGWVDVTVTKARCRRLTVFQSSRGNPLTSGFAPGFPHWSCNTLDPILTIFVSVKSEPGPMRLFDSPLRGQTSTYWQKPCTNLDSPPGSLASRICCC
jgi:hypothetical protein